MQTRLVHNAATIVLLSILLSSLTMGDPSWLTDAPTTTEDSEVTTTPSTTPPSFKVVLVGEAGVGKTAIFSRIRQPDYPPCETALPPSVGIDTCKRTMCTQHGDVTITVWDTAGAEKYRTLTRNYYRNTDAVMLVFSVNNPPSLYSLPDWQKDISKSAPSAVQFLVGNKSDLERRVDDEVMHCFADSHNCQAAFLASAKTGEGVEDALRTICSQLLRVCQNRQRMHSRDRLWLQGSGVHVHGDPATHPALEPTYKCCF